MSHTGDVIRPDESPGMIRVITTGYVVTKSDKLVFQKPRHSREKKPDYFWEAQERFILYLNLCDEDFRFGQGVKFNLERFSKWKEYIDACTLWKIKQSIPNFWIKKMGGIKPGKSLSKKMRRRILKKFKFKYVATEVQALPEDFVMYDFYNFINDIDPDNMEDLLLCFDKIKRFKMRCPIKINCAGGDRIIKDIRFVEESEFCRLTDNYVEVKENVSYEMNMYGQHFITSSEELPTRIKRIKV
jgi:hypothetical protein